MSKKWKKPTVDRRVGALKGRWGRRIIKTVREGNREWQYHATKGWRSYRV